MDYKINYELTAKIEIINEFSFSVYSRLLNYVLKNNYEGDPFYEALLESFQEVLSVDIEFLDAEKLEKVLLYWKAMNQYIKQIT